MDLDQVYSRFGFLSSIQYESFVKTVIDKILRDSLKCDYQVRHNCKVPGKSGHEHQVDVLAEFYISGIRMVIIAECKKYSRKVGIDEILEFSSRIEDISANKGIMVTTVGFQEGALTLAASKNIALVRIDPRRKEGYSHLISPIKWNPRGEGDSEINYTVITPRMVYRGPASKREIPDICEIIEAGISDVDMITKVLAYHIMKNLEADMAPILTKQVVRT